MSDNKRWDFFKEGDTSYGVFYPEHYTVAAFADRQGADSAAEAARTAGFAAEDVRAVDGQFMVNELETDHDKSWMDKVKTRIADAVGTETRFIELDVEHARRGAAFLFIYTPDDTGGEKAEALLRSSNALYARRYLPMAIERLIEPPRVD